MAASPTANQPRPLKSWATRVGFIVANLSRLADRVVAFYKKRGTCEQMDQGRSAIKWTRLSCRTFAANAVRLQLHTLIILVTFSAMRPDASENGQISWSTIVRAARAAGSHPHLASGLQQGRKSANICVSFG